MVCSQYVKLFRWKYLLVSSSLPLVTNCFVFCSAKTSSDLRKHVASHNIDAPFSCHMDGCTYTSRSYVSLSNHFKRKHQVHHVLDMSIHFTINYQFI